MADKNTLKLLFFLIGMPIAVLLPAKASATLRCSYTIQREQQ